MDCATIGVKVCSTRRHGSSVHTAGVKTEVTTSGSQGVRFTRKRSLLVPVRSLSTVDNAHTVAISPCSASHEWPPSNGALQNKRGSPLEMCGSSSPDRSHSSHNVDCTSEVCRIPDWDGVCADMNAAVNDNAAPEGLLVNTEVSDSKALNGVHARCGRYMSQLQGHSLPAKNECNHHHYRRRNHHQQQQHCDANDLGSYNINGNAAFHTTRTPLLHMMPGGGQQQNHGVIPHHHAVYQNSQHHVLGASRRFQRRRGFGAAAVEAIRNRTTLEVYSPQQVQLSPTRRYGKWQKHANSGFDQDHRTVFPVPLPRSKSFLCSTCHLTTPGDKGDFTISHSAPASELGSAVAGENASNALLLSGIAPFYDCAIQQLIIECEQRVANASDAGCGLSRHRTSPCLQMDYRLHQSVNAHSFDTPSSVAVKPSSLPSSKPTLLHALPSTQIHPQEGRLSPSEPVGMEACLGSSNCMGAACRGDHSCEGWDGALMDAAMSGGLFASSTEDTKEVLKTYGMVQPLVESIALHVPFGDSAPMVLIGSLVYMSRIVSQSSSVYSNVTTANWYCLTTIAILLATKMYVDGSQRWNECIANASGIPLKEVNKFELDFLFFIDFDLLIKEEEVEAWAEWMESVAKRCGMRTPLRTFILGRSSCTPSNTTTPMSSFVSEDIFLRSVTHIPSGNRPSTPISFTPVNMTPNANAHTSPGASKSFRFSYRPSQSFVLDANDRHTRTVLHSQASTSQLPVCEVLNFFPPSPLQAVLAPRKTERLFSIVHAPPEPMTPLSLRQLSLLADTVGNVLLTPPEQQPTSPVGFFQRSTRMERNLTTNTSAHKWKKGKGALPNESIEDDGEEVCKWSLGEQNGKKTATLQRAPDVPSLPMEERVSSHDPEAEHRHPHQCKSNGAGNNSEAVAVKVVYYHEQSWDEVAVSNSFAEDRSFFSTCQEYREAECNMIKPHENASVDHWKQMVTRACEVFGLTQSFAGATSLDANEVGSASLSKNGNRVGGGGAATFSDSDEEGDYDGFEDDFEEDRNDIFARWNRLPTHSPPM